MLNFYHMIEKIILILKNLKTKWNNLELFPESFSNNIYIFHNFKALYCSSTIVKNLSINQIDHFFSFNQ